MSLIQGPRGVCSSGGCISGVSAVQGVVLEGFPCTCLHSVLV